MKLDPTQLLVIVDSREQRPFDLSPMQMKVDGLATGDYSLAGLEDLVCVERKELNDLIGCIGSGRERFKRELHRMKAYPARCVVVEATWSELASGNYRSRLHPESAMNTVATWMGEFSVPFMFLGDRASAEKFTGQFLFHQARKYFERAEMFQAAVSAKR